jgi:hypothetical protein
MAEMALTGLQLGELETHGGSAKCSVSRFLNVVQHHNSNDRDDDRSNAGQKEHLH